MKSRTGLAVMGLAVALAIGMAVRGRLGPNTASEPPGTTTTAAIEPAEPDKPAEAPSIPVKPALAPPAAAAKEPTFTIVHSPERTTQVVMKQPGAVQPDPTPIPPAVMSSAPRPPSFEDNRSLSGRDAERAEKASVTEETGPRAVGAPSVFADPRDLLARDPATATRREAPSQTRTVVVERRETVVRTDKGLSVDRRDVAPRPSAPSFADGRELPTTAPAAPTPGPTQVASAPPLPPPASVVPAPVILAPAAKPEPPATVIEARPAIEMPPPALPRAEPPPRRCNPPEVVAEPLEGGRSRVTIGAPCLTGQRVLFAYGGVRLAGEIDQAGRLETVIDQFAGTDAPLNVTFDDGATRTVKLAATDLDKVDKIALVWRAPVDLDLHAFEYGASVGQIGHVWTGKPSAALTARELAASNQRARGFLSRSDTGKRQGDKVEVYTLFTSAEQVSGRIAVAVDFASRAVTPTPDTCGRGANAEVAFEIIVSRGGRVTRETSVFTPVACDLKLSAEARYPIVQQIRVAR